MEITLLGIVMDVRPEQYSNALLPMEVTLYMVPPYSTSSGITISPEYLGELLITAASFLSESRE